MMGKEADEVPTSPQTECTSHSQSIFGKVFRRLSLKRKSSRSSLHKRKNSQSPSNDYNLEGFFQQVDQNVARLDTHTFFNVEVSRDCLVTTFVARSVEMRGVAMFGLGSKSR